MFYKIYFSKQIIKIGMKMASLSIEFIFPLITTTVSLLFFLSVSEQYLRKRKTHQLIWAISIFFFLITSGAESWSLILGLWDPLIYKVYYVLASFQVAIMGAGALYLFASRNIINERNSGVALILFGCSWLLFSFIGQFGSPIFLWILIPAFLITLLGIFYSIQVIMSSKREKSPSFNISGMWFSHLFILFTLYIFIFMVITAISAPLDLNLLLNSGGQEVAGSGWLSTLPDSRPPIRLFSPLNTVPGSLALIGGAAYSYLTWQLAIKKRSGKFNLKKGLFNVYIGGGALVLSIAGAMSGFGFGVLYLGEALGVALMYFGFLESDKITLRKIVNILTLSWIRNKEDSSLTDVKED